jgi:hypothetical protein
VILIIALLILAVLADSLVVVLILRISFIFYHGLYKIIPLARNAPHQISLAHHTKRHHLQYQVHTIFKVLPSSHENIWVHEGHLQGAKNCSQVGHAENYQHSDDESEEAEILCTHHINHININIFKYTRNLVETLKKCLDRKEEMWM